jgi:hypothetical protein
LISDTKVLKNNAASALAATFYNIQKNKGAHNDQFAPLTEVA